MKEVITTSNSAIPDGYAQWREEIEKLIECSKLQAVFHVNKELLSLYWQIGSDILSKQKMYGWGAQVIARLSADLSKRFPGDRGYSLSNLKSMRRFAEAYPDFPVLKFPVKEIRETPIGQVWLDQLGNVEGEFGQDKPTIGLLLCRTKSDKKAEFALRGITQPMGIAGYETEKLFAEVASALPKEFDIDKVEDAMPTIEEIENAKDDDIKDGDGTKEG